MLFERKNIVKDLQIECRILYLCIQQKYIKNSTKKENSNRSLNKLTNETIDNQPVNVPKNNEQEQEQKKTTKRVEKVDDADDAVFEKRKTSPNPSEGGERTPLANSVFLQISSRRNSRIQTYKRLVRPIFFRISPQTFPRIQACKRLAHSKSLHMTPQTSLRLRVQKRLARSTPLAVFTARADAMQHSPGPQARAPSLWEGRGRYLEGEASVPACNMAHIGLQHGSFHRAK